MVRFELGALRLLGPYAVARRVRRVRRAGGRRRAESPSGNSTAACCARRVVEERQQVVMVSAGVLRAMAQLADPDGHAWRRLEIDPRSLGELRGVLNHYFTHLLGRKPRMHEYLGMLGS